jgi:NAD(P)-dependent dehydrogenase (short-subunit alcohol dehydrogenase family)
MSTITYGTTPETNSERVFEVNYLSNAILSVRLLPLLRASAEKSKSTSYISIVSSRALPTNSFAKYPIPDSTSLFDFMSDPKQYRGIYRYGDSKMLVSLWVRELAKHTDASVVTVNNVCPGLVSTNIDVIQVWWLKHLLLAVRAVAARSQEVGARTLIYAASAGTETHGEMLADYNVWQ